MKAVFMTLLALTMIISSLAKAEGRLEKYERVLSQLSDARKNLEELERQRSEHKSDIIEAAIGGVVWGVIGGGAAYFGRGEPGSTMGFVGKIILAGDAVTVVAIEGYKAYRMNLNGQQLKALTIIIKQKEGEFSDARQALLELENK